MPTIVIPVSDKRPEDNILDLVQLISEEFGEEIIKVTNAMVIETKNPNIAALFRKIAENSGSFVSKANGKHSEAVCIDCGKPVGKPGNRCKGCASKLSAKKRSETKAGESGVEVENGLLE
jgi:DNA-directed RNA polymerase subunit RPC12/RpoP